MSDSTTRSAFLRGADIPEGGVEAIIKDEAVWVKGEYKGQETRQYLATVEVNGEEKTLKFTKLSRNNMHAIGTDSLTWINRKVKLKTVDVMVDGNIYKSIVVEPMDAPAESSNPPEQVPWDE